MSALSDAYAAATAAVDAAMSAVNDAYAAAQAVATQAAVDVLDATMQTAQDAANTAAAAAEAAGRAAMQAAANLADAAAELPADAAQALKDAAAAAYAATLAAAAAALDAALHAGQSALDGGLPWVGGLGGQSGGAGASGDWKPAVKRQDRRAPEGEWAVDILQRQRFWRLTLPGESNPDNYWQYSWRAREHWAWASLSGLGKVIDRPCEDFTEFWTADIASAFRRWCDDAAWLSTDPDKADWLAAFADADGVSGEESPAWIEGGERYGHASRVVVVAPNTPVYDEQCAIVQYVDVERSTTPEERLLERGTPPVTHYTSTVHANWGFEYEGWFLLKPLVKRIYWFFPRLGSLWGKVGFPPLPPIPPPPLFPIFPALPGVGIGAKVR